MKLQQGFRAPCTLSVGRFENVSTQEFHTSGSQSVSTGVSAAGDVDLIVECETHSTYSTTTISAEGQLLMNYPGFIFEFI